MSWRPRNETDEDTKRESDAAAYIERVQWPVRVMKLSEALYKVDWAIFSNNKQVAWGEYKHRNQRYDTLLLSAAKYYQARHLNKLSGLPCYWFMSFDGDSALYKANLTDSEKPVLRPEIGGSSRGQNGDEEPCVFIPWSWFSRVGQREHAAA